jgi:hypothetical protein
MFRGLPHDGTLSSFLDDNVSVRCADLNHCESYRRDQAMSPDHLDSACSHRSHPFTESHRYATKRNHASYPIIPTPITRQFVPAFRIDSLFRHGLFQLQSLALTERHGIVTVIFCYPSKAAKRLRISSSTSSKICQAVPRRNPIRSSLGDQRPTPCSNASSRTALASEVRLNRRLEGPPSRQLYCKTGEIRVKPEIPLMLRRPKRTRLTAY